MEKGKLGRTCPIMNRDCLESSCAWWIIGDNTCSIVRIALLSRR